MKKLNCLLGLLFTLNVTCLVAQKEAVQEPELAKEIRKMRDEDQKMRVKWSRMIQKGKSETEKFKDLTKELIAKDRTNTARLRVIVEEYGWPTYDLVGKRSSNSAWLIVQHADRNPLFQVKCLPLLKKAVDEGRANPSNYAYLYDRVQVAKGEKQLYATQSSSNNGLYEGNFFPIDDESNVQQRREEMNLQQSVVAYANSMGFSYVVPTPEEAQVRAQSQMESYEINLERANKAMKAQNYSESAEAYLKVVKAFGHVTTEDFVEAARSLSLAKHKEARLGTVYLIKAMVRGWDGLNEIINQPDFSYLKEASKANWEDFMKTAADMSIDRQ